MQRARFHSWDAIEAWPLGELFRTKFLAATRADNDIRLVADDFFSRHDAIFGCTRVVLPPGKLPITTGFKDPHEGWGSCCMPILVRQLEPEALVGTPIAGLQMFP